MMTLRYIFHSGFLLETARCILVFDYWMDPADVMSGYMNTCKHVYMFSSHFHEDHFTKEIFKWKNRIPNITYILSKDILKRRRAQKEDADIWMAKGAVWEDENLKVTATGRKRTEQREQKPSWLGLCRVASDEGEANDSGVSWIVETEGKTIFHAGDLCNWYARFLVDNTPEGEIFSEEFGQYINPVAEEKQFLGELKDIRKITDSFDLVMFPVDGRIGNGYTLGGRQFIESFKVGMFVPMHFVMSGFESAWRMEPFCKEKNVPFWCIEHEGDSITI